MREKVARTFMDEFCYSLGDLVGEDAQIRSSWRSVNIRGVTSDSRDVRSGFLFAAFPGSRVDGSSFVLDACRRGAAAIIADEQSRFPPGLGVPLILSPNPRHLFALIASRFYPDQPENLVAVTGTNGKTSVCSFLRQIWQSQGLHSASLGTIGLVTQEKTVPLSHTTPEPLDLHQHLSGLAHEGVTHVAFEASSHGCAQSRIDGVHLSAAGFTNISHDHLDYHGSFADYLKQKLRLFEEVLPSTGKAVINADAEYADRFVEALQKRKIPFLTVGAAGNDLKLLAVRPAGLLQTLDIASTDGQKYQVNLPLVGTFQVSNALVAAGLAIACGMRVEDALLALDSLEGVIGRLEMVGTTPENAPIFIDYAHTPDALQKVLEALRPYARRHLVVVFGAGGDRDREKRPKMGEVAQEYADIVIVTDDNPRKEDPAKIREEILGCAPDAIEIGDRGTAIAAGIRMLKQGDVLVIAGKGHEVGQSVRGVTIPFSDHAVVRASLGDARHWA